MSGFKTAFGSTLCYNVTLIGCSADGVESFVSYDRTKDATIIDCHATNVSGNAIDLNWVPGVVLNGFSVNSQAASDAVPLSAVGQYFEQLLKSKGGGVQPSGTPGSKAEGGGSMSEKFTAFRAKNSEGSKVENMYADGFGIGIDLEDSPNGEFKNLIFRAPGAGEIDPSIVRAFAEAMRDSSQINRGTVEEAAKKSGLLKWASDHGFEAASFITDLTEKAVTFDWASIF